MYSCLCHQFTCFGGGDSACMSSISLGGGVFNKKTSVNVKMVTTINVNETTSMTWSGPRRPLFLHALSFECTSKMCINFLNKFSVYFHI